MSIPVKDVRSILNDLIQTCKDSQEGFIDAAHHVKDSNLKEIFLELSQQRSMFAGELQQEVTRLGAEPEKAGSTTGALHRGWLDFKARISGQKDPAVVREVEAEEESAVNAYEKAMTAELPADLRNIVARQYKFVLESQAQIRAMQGRTIGERRSRFFGARPSGLLRARKDSVLRATLVQNPTTRPANHCYNLSRVPQSADCQSRRDCRPDHPHAARDEYPDGSRLFRCRSGVAARTQSRRGSAHRPRAFPAKLPQHRSHRIDPAARRHGVEAIHPGYGFLSENADFAAACEQAGIVFVGPASASIRQMGSKTGARQVAAAAGAPIVPGVHEGGLEPTAAREFSRAAGYPVMLKAVAGGGGKGMRRVDREADLEAAFRDASSEAERAFGDGAIYVVKLIERPRHIEIQVFGDTHGNAVHLGERECSIQRRHQKIIEECPSPLIAAHPEMREQMGDAAVKIARAAGYYNAGTIEFLVDESRNFYFLEMNTRLQVEHPVTEWVTGVDLVRWQMEVAAGGKLPLPQEQIDWRGAAIECRVYAEDPDNHFFPSPGRIERLSEPAGPGVRLDSGVYAGWNVPLDYDPMLAKLAVWAGTRTEAIARMRRAIGEYRIAGIRTNLKFFDRILADKEFADAALDTGFLERFFGRVPSPPEPSAQLVSLAAAVVDARLGGKASGSVNGTAAGAASAWLQAGRDQVQR